MIRKITTIIFFCLFLGFFFATPTKAQCSGSYTYSYTQYGCACNKDAFGDCIPGTFSCNGTTVTTSQSCHVVSAPTGSSCMADKVMINNACSATSTGCNIGSQTIPDAFTCSAPQPSSTPGPTPAQGCGQCNTCGIPQWCALENGVCVVDSCLCAGVGCPTSNPTDPCPGDTCPGTCCNYECGHSCIVTQDCKPGGYPRYCNPVTHTCVNANCPNNTIPGPFCACSGGLVCGQVCTGGCTNQSICTFTDPTCAGTAPTYCVGISAPDPVNPNADYSTFNPNYIGSLCSPGAWHLHQQSPSQDTGFTQAQINATCKAGPWWQVKDGDVVTNGTIQSIIPLACTSPCNPNFILNGAGGYPGVASYGASTAPIFSVAGGSGKVSSKGWLANTSYNGKSYDYAFFEGLIPPSISVNEITSDTIDGNYFQVNGTPSQGFVWFRRTGNLTITGNQVNVNNTRKVLLLVKGGDLTIQSKIRLQQVGNGFFMAVVNGSIFFASNLVGSAGQPAVEGLFLADNQIHTGAGTQQLYVRGTLSALGGLSLERDLGNNNGTTPAEFIEYAPDLLFAYPRDLTRTRRIWREVAP